MRLTCPTCGAEYEIADAMVPAAGRHVQCTACHTRWFVRRGAPKRDTEDEIMRRLEARSHLRAVPSPPQPPLADLAPEPTPDEVPAPADASAAPAVPASNTDPTAPETAAPETAAPETAVPDPVAPEPVASETAPTVGDRRPSGRLPPLPTPPAPAPLPPVPPRAVPAKPADRPMLASASVGLRPAPRLDLGAEVPPAPPREVARPSRFGRGLLLVLVFFGLALAAYVWRAELGTRLPAAAPALAAYGHWVDDLRLDLDEAFDRLGGAAG